MLIVTALFGCGGGDGDSVPTTPTTPTTQAKSVTGSVSDPVTGLPVSGATVSAFVQSSIAKSTAKAVAAPVAVATFTTDANGNYTVTGLLEGVTYYFEISIPGYAIFVYYNILPLASSDLTLERASLLPSSIATQTATASGKVLNASTNAGLPNMTVKIRSGVNNQTGSIVETSTTDATGAYSFTSLSAGTYTAEVSGNIETTPIITSYFTLFSIPGTPLPLINSNQNFPVTTALSTTGTGQYRIVLDWGNNPNDLDSHLTGPTATSPPRFHVYFNDEDFPSGSTSTATTSYLIAGPTTEAFLDVDNTEHGYDNGPETTTIVVPRTGTYRFYVHHYSGSSTISASGAQVKVYRGSALLATYNPPYSTLGEDAVWSVFSMDVTASGQTITAVNTITIPTDGTYGLAKVAGDGFEEYFIFSNLPRK
jgi:hypothetical protein